MSHDPRVLPPNLPVPIDDGAAGHLFGARLPAIELVSTRGRSVELARVGSADQDRPEAHTTGPRSGGVVLFFYPRTGVPGQPPSLGFRGEEWDSIPGARGCTPQSCGFRDLHAEYAALGIGVFGVSTSTPEHQREFVERNHIPFEMLSDAELRLTRAMRLPTFEFPVESGGPTTLIHRMAWYVEPDGLGKARVARVWYPVFPPDQNAQTVLAWLKRRAAVQVRPADASDAAFVRDELTEHWGGVGIWSLGRMYRGDEIQGLVGLIDGERVGLVTYAIQPGGYSVEIVTVSSRRPGAGVASKLLAGAAEAGRAAGCVRAFLTTTNDNIRAIEFYQRQGWRLAAVHKGAVDEARKRKPMIPRVGRSGIPIRDEVELELWLEEEAG